MKLAPSAHSAKCGPPVIRQPRPAINEPHGGQKRCIQLEAQGAWSSPEHESSRSADVGPRQTLGDNLLPRQFRHGQNTIGICCKKACAGPSTGNVAAWRGGCHQSLSWLNLRRPGFGGLQGPCAAGGLVRWSAPLNQARISC